MFDEVAFLVSVGVGVSVLFLVWGWRVRGVELCFSHPQGNQNIKELYLVPAPFQGVPTKPFGNHLVPFGRSRYTKLYEFVKVGGPCLNGH